MHDVDVGAAETALRQLVDDYRATCLWFLRQDYDPSTPVERDRVLGLIVERGDVQALQRVTALRRWLSPISSETSAGC